MRSPGNRVLWGKMMETTEVLGNLNLSGSNSPPLGASTFANIFGFDTPRLAAGLFISAPMLQEPII